MDAGLTIKPIGAQGGYARPDSSLRAAVATELDPSQTVTAALDNAAATAHDLPRSTSPSLQPSISHEVLIDPQAREVMFRVMALRAGRVAGDAPEEAMLKLKAYTRVERKKRRADGDTLETTA